MALHIPSDENPLIYDKDCIFYKKHLIVDGLKLEYKDLAIICHKSESKYVNGINITKKADAEYFFDKTNTSFFKDCYGSFVMDIKKGLLPINNHLIKQFDYIHQFLSEISFENRLYRTKHFIEKDGFLSISNVQFHNNGDIYCGNDFQGNIKKAFEDGKLIWGDKYGGYKHKISDPYSFKIIKGSSFLGFLEDSFSYSNFFNKDIFDLLVTNCIKTGKMTGKMTGN